MSADLIEQIRRQMIERELFPEHYRKERLKSLISGDSGPDDLGQKSSREHGLSVHKQPEVTTTSVSGSTSQ